MGNCTLENIDLTSMDLKHAIMANCIFRRCIFINTQLQQSDLSGARFIDCQLRNVDMTETDLRGAAWENGAIVRSRSEEHTSELQSLMRISYAVFCLKKK